VQLVLGKIDLFILIHLGKSNILGNTGIINKLISGFKIKELFAKLVLYFNLFNILLNDPFVKSLSLNILKLRITLILLIF
jgi:hypothetical protein